MHGAAGIGVDPEPLRAAALGAGDDVRRPEVLAVEQLQQQRLFAVVCTVSNALPDIPTSCSWGNVPVMWYDAEELKSWPAAA